MEKVKRIIAAMLAGMMICIAGAMPVQAAGNSDGKEVVHSRLSKQKSAGLVLEEELVLPSGKNVADIGTEIENFVSEHSDTMAGMAVSLIDGEETLYEGYFGYADKEAKIAVDEQTVFEWGSATKTLVWVSVMQQVEQGRIDLNTDIREYLPEGFLTNSAYDTPVTMMHLITHSAGYQEVLVDLFERDISDVHPLGEQLKKNEPAQIFEPGTVTAYCNWGVALAAYIVECVSGEDFCDYVHHHIFDVLQMEHSALAPDLSDNAWVAEKRKKLQCYTTDGTLIPNCFFYIALYPAGMCTSTLADMRTWTAALATRDERILSAETWEEFYQPTLYFSGTDVPRNCHGLWTELRNSIIVGHGGNTAGCSSYILVEPETGLGAVIMTNQSGESVFNSDMMDLVFGPLDRTLYFDPDAKPEGAYRPARAIFKGPLKVYGASFVGGFDNDKVWNYAENVYGRTLVQMSVFDFIKTPLPVMVLECVLVYGTLLSLLAALVVLIAKIIYTIVQKIRKRPAAVTLGKWQWLSCAAMLAVTVVGIFIVISVSGYYAYDDYKFLFYIATALMLFLIALFFYGFAGTVKNKMTKKCRALNILLLVNLLLTSAFLVYYEVWRFWVV